MSRRAATGMVFVMLISCPLVLRLTAKSASLWVGPDGYLASTSGEGLDGKGVYALPPMDWEHYHNYTEIVTILLALNQTYPDIVDVFSIGKSWWNREIYCVRLTNESAQGIKPEVLFVGYHHAREPITAELSLYFVVHTATNYGTSQALTEVVDRSEIYVVVALNVDGFDLFEANDWHRKNARPTDEDSDTSIDEDSPEDEDEDGFIEQLIDYSNPNYPTFVRWEGIDNDGDTEYGEDWIGGVDLNRNYDYAWELGSSQMQSEIYKGPTPFSEPETQAIRDFVLDHDFTYAISFHSGVELIVYPWGSTLAPPPDEALFIEVAQDLSSITGGTPYEQGSEYYFTYGVWDDWMYGVAKVYAFTCEVFYNSTWEGVGEPGPSPNTMWEGGLKHWFNPFPQGIETTILRWLPVFYYIANRTINEAFHNVAVEALTPQKTVIGEGYTLRLNVSLRNEGSFEEAFNVTIYANSTIVQTQNATLAPRASSILMFAWDTSDVAKGCYVISAHVSQVPDEENTTDNSSDSIHVEITIPGDMDADKDVDIYDIVMIAGLYGEVLPPVPWPQPPADIDGDSDIDIYDVVIAAGNYGESWQP